jgi:hypothetical protein
LQRETIKRRINMKKLFLLTVVFALSLSMQAQDDDMYFVPSKESKAQDAKNYGLPRNTYYSGSQRSVDDYNRKSWTIVPADSTGNDIIDFSAVRGIFPDSATVDSASVASGEDYQLTRKMSRFDDYTPSQAYWDGYRDGRYMSPWYYSYNSWYWNDPWYWRSSWYWNDPWYYGYYSPWYYGGYHSPWYYGGYYNPWYYGGYYGPYYGVGYAIGGVRGGGSGRPVNHRSKLNGSNYGGRRDRSTRTYNNNDGSRSFGGYRSNSTPSNSSFGGSRGGGSFSSGGGSHSSGGGGSFGGGRSASGGRSYGGKR